MCNTKQINDSCDCNKLFSYSTYILFIFRNIKKKNGFILNIIFDSGEKAFLEETNEKKKKKLTKSKKFQYVFFLLLAYDELGIDNTELLFNRSVML